jgi:hypothetical protein
MAKTKRVAAGRDLASLYESAQPISSSSARRMECLCSSVDDSCCSSSWSTLGLPSKTIACYMCKANQNQLRAELYRGAVDAIQLKDLDVRQIGRRIVLPSSFTGGPHHMMHQYQGALALMQRFIKPDLFVTVTCNPNWPEIRRHMPPNGEASYDPATVCRVFRLKLKALMQAVVKKDVFGPVASWVYTIGFQRRGLPHAHILVSLEEHFKPITAADTDAIVCAQLPDPAAEESLLNIVTKQMLHVCDHRCGGDGVNADTCSKLHPRPFQDATAVVQNRVPQVPAPSKWSRAFPGESKQDGHESACRAVQPLFPLFRLAHQRRGCWVSGMPTSTSTSSSPRAQTMRGLYSVRKKVWWWWWRRGSRRK